MDNLAHSLAGAALAEAGLKHKTGLGMATLIIAANLPDIDVLGLLIGENLAWRRGWTHGPLAMLVLPPLLVGAMILFDRWQARRGTRPTGRLPIHAGWLLGLAYIGWLSHPALDFLNTYGIRLLMPLSDQWFYGDTLFIIDIWLWLALGLGVFWSRRRQKQAQPNAYQPARISLALSMAYIGAMGASSVIAEDMTRATADAAGRGPVTDVVASPVPLNPFRRDVVFVANDSYGLGVVTWLPTPHVTLEKTVIPTQMDNPLVAKARASKEVADFLYWARLPYARFEQTPQGQRVVLTDARYSIGAVRNPFLISVTLPDDMAAHQSKGPPQRP